MKIQWIKDTSKAIVEDIPPDTLVVYHPMYTPPNISGAEYMEFGKFKAKYVGLHFNKLILVGLNRIITPQNRCEMVNDFMQTLTRSIPKVSIDTAPFVGEPWRMWYHFDITNSGRFNLPHGYAMETEWKHWFYYDTNECRLDAKNIGQFIDSIYSDLPQLETSFSFFEQEDDFYEEIKSFVFNKYDSPKLIINNLLKECNKHYQLTIGFDSYLSNKKISVPELGIYKFIVEENKRRQNIYNKVIGWKEND